MTFVGLLRAVNVAGRKLPMADLRALCERCGFEDVRTYIQSGNVIFGSRGSVTKAKATLEKALEAYFGAPCRVVMRTAPELEAAIAANPFPEAAPNQLLVLFLDAPPSKAEQQALATLKIPGRERLSLVGRELFIHFPDGMGRSKLKVPLAGVGTGRNLNTVRALLEMAREA